MVKYVNKARKLLVHTILHADDSPHQIALGAALAIFVAFLPIIGIQTAVAVGLAAALRANKAVCIPLVWVTNPVTAPFIFGACFALGRFVLGSSTGDTQLATFFGFLAEHGGWASVLTFEFWRDVAVMSVSLGTELWVGCSIVAVVIAIPFYFSARWTVITYRLKNRARIARRAEKRELRKARRETKFARTSRSV